LRFTIFRFDLIAPQVFIAVARALVDFPCRRNRADFFREIRALQAGFLARFRSRRAMTCVLTASPRYDMSRIVDDPLTFS
jgi:hypothetical protein